MDTTNRSIGNFKFSHFSTFRYDTSQFRPVLRSGSHILNLPDHQKTVSKHPLRVRTAKGNKRREKIKTDIFISMKERFSISCAYDYYPKHNVLVIKPVTLGASYEELQQREADISITKQ